MGQTTQVSRKFVIFEFPSTFVPCVEALLIGLAILQPSNIEIIEGHILKHFFRKINSFINSNSQFQTPIFQREGQHPKVAYTWSASNMSPDIPRLVYWVNYDPSAL